MEPCKHDWYFYETIKALKCTRCGKTTTPVIRAETNEPKVLYAFPNPHRTDELGMPLRDYFAAKAMQAMLSSPEFLVVVTADQAVGGNAKDRVSNVSFAYADAMLKAREA